MEIMVARDFNSYIVGLVLHASLCLTMAREYSNNLYDLETLSLCVEK